MASIRDALARLPDDAARSRVVRWAADVAGISVAQTPSATRDGASQNRSDEGFDHGDLVEILDAAQPDSRAEKILVVAFWLERSSGAADWSAQAVNDEPIR